MRDKCRRICLISGFLLIIAAIALCIYNIAESRKAEKRSQSVMTELRAEIEEYAAEEASETITESDLFAEYEPTEQEEMQVISVDGTDYCGYLSIEELGIELPVINEFSYASLKTAPCRYSGSVAENDIIIAAHNYSTHFGRLNSLSDGSEIVFTDCSGKSSSYNVISIEEIDGSDKAQMFSGEGTDWDLTLFTCTLSGKRRVTVRAKKNKAP